MNVETTLLRSVLEKNSSYFTLYFLYLLVVNHSAYAYFSSNFPLSYSGLPMNTDNV